MGFEIDNEPDHTARIRRKKTEDAAQTLINYAGTLDKDLSAPVLDRLKSIVEIAREAKRRAGPGGRGA